MSDSEQPTNKLQLPRRNVRDPLRSKWGVAIAASLVFHVGMGAVLALNPPRPIPKEEDRRPYTAETYTKKTESAQAKVQKMEQIARKMENLQQKARENYEKRTGQKLPPLPSTPATPPPDAPAASKPNGEAARSAEEAQMAQREAQEAQQNVETALREADAALAKGDLTGYQESARRAAQAARKVAEAQSKAIAAQQKAKKASPPPKLPAEKPVIDAAMKQQIAAAQAQRTVQLTVDQAAVAPTLDAARKAQAEAKAAQAESAQKQVLAKQQQEAMAKEAAEKNGEGLPQPQISPQPPGATALPDPVTDALNQAGASAMQTMLSQEMALKALNTANTEAHEAVAAKKDVPSEGKEKPEGKEPPENKGNTGENSPPAEKQTGDKANAASSPEKGSEAPAAPRPQDSASDKSAGTTATPAPSANSSSPSGAPQSAATDRKSGAPDNAPRNALPSGESLDGVEKALAEAAQYQKEAATQQQAAQKSLGKGGKATPGQNQARQQAQRAAAEAQSKAERARQEAEKALASSNPEAVEQALNTAIAAQRSAMAAQAQANSNQEGASASGRPATGRPSRPGSSTSAPPGQQTPPNDLGNALSTAQNTEARINSMYGEIRALERASTGRVPLNQARRETRTENQEGGGDAVANTRITGQSPARAVNETEQKIDAMAARAQRMLDQAQAQQGSSARVFADRMVSLATQDMGGRIADLSGGMGNQASSRTRRRLPGDPDYIPPPPPPALPNAAINAIPGRRVTRGNAPPATWMFVDSWYVIGPFANPARRNLNTKFPPETRVDLDATYPGMDGRKLKWQFWQYNSPEMVPPDHQEYAIYYYYTELYFDSPRDAWVAVGSDDQSTLWLNGQLTWKSSDQLKGWQIGEGLRRVHFKAGRNPILVRLENGWRGAAVSVVVALRD